MSSQVIERKILSGASGAGSLIPISSSTEATPNIVHTSGSSTTTQQAIFLEAHNNADREIVFHVFWMPSGASYSTSNRLTYKIGPFEDLVISDGLSLGRDDNISGDAIAVYLDDAGDAGELMLRGYYDIIPQSIS